MTDKFLSTPSARRATTCCRCGAACGAYFYPRPPRGGRRSAAGLEGQAGRFLSTPSARRATPMSRSICARRSKFLSTPSARRATLYNHRHAHCCQISIHALREEGDRVRFLRSSQRHNFYPRPPRGGRPATALHRGKAAVFLSTPSARRATAAGCFDGTDKTYFYPRPPRGGRHTSVPSLSQAWIFLSTPSARRATVHTQQPLWEREISIHALREEGDFVVYC